MAWIGLHIASQIAQAHGGRIDVTSTPEETRFPFTMPLTSPDITCVSAPRQGIHAKERFDAPCFSKEGRITSKMARSKSVILLVEDELLLRMDSAELIENAGFEVVQAANADEAIDMLTARPDIHVVFTDIQMPGTMDGLKLARFVRDRWPPIKIVATSGLVRVGEDDLPAGGVFLPKPYRGEEIIGVLRGLSGRI